MQVILSYFLNLCLLREGPERIPPSLVITSFLGLLYVIVEFVSLHLNRPGLSLLSSIGIMVVALGIEAGSLYVLLLFKRYQHRLLSTLSAVFACNAILLLVLIPVNYLIANVDEGMLEKIVEGVSLVLVFWWLAIVGFILHRAAQISIFQGVVLAFVIELIVAVVLRGTFSELNN